MPLHPTKPQEVKPIEERIISHLGNALTLPRLDRFATDHSVPHGFFDHLRYALEGVDVYTVAIKKQHAFESKCGAGCSSCCYLAPGSVYGVEYLDMYRQLSSGPRKAMRSVAETHAENADAFLKQWSNLVIKAVILSPREDKEEVVRTIGELAQQPSARVELERMLIEHGTCFERLGAHRDYFLHAKKLCAFNDQGSCGVYDTRPVTCRGHQSSIDPFWCSPKTYNPNGKTSVHFPQEISSLMSAIDKRMGLELSPVLPLGFTQLYTMLNGKPILQHE